MTHVFFTVKINVSIMLNERDINTHEKFAINIHENFSNEFNLKIIEHCFVVKCWMRWPNEYNMVFSYPRKNKSLIIITQHRSRRWPNAFNMPDSTMLNVLIGNVESISFTWVAERLLNSPMLNGG